MDQSLSLVRRYEGYKSKKSMKTVYLPPQEYIKCIQTGHLSPKMYKVDVIFTNSSQLQRYFLCVPGERIPEERVWAPRLPSQRHLTREHDGRYICQRGWEQRRLHILQRVHVQARWTLKSLWHWRTGWIVGIIWPSVWKSNVGVRVVCDVFLCVFVWGGAVL